MTANRSSRLLVVVGAIVCLATTAMAQSNPNTAPKADAQKKTEPKGQPVTADKLDPSLFEAKNQRECDRPRACGCNCEDAPQAPQKNQ